MCGRYLVEISEEELREIAAALDTTPADGAVSPCGNSDELTFTFAGKGGEIFPGSVAPVITGNNEVRFMKWGFPGIIAKQSYINARSETAAASRTFGEAMAARRCIVPASGYYEWKTRDKKHKAKYKFTIPDQTLMFMAGIYSVDGQFAILTRAAVSAITEIHDRMPVILSKSLAEMWLQESPDALNEALTDLEFSPVPAVDKQPEQTSLFN